MYFSIRLKIKIQIIPDKELKNRLCLKCIGRQPSKLSPYYNGTIMIEVNNGKFKGFGPGSALWIADTELHSKDHKSRVKNDTGIIAVAARIDEDRLN